MGLRLRLRPFEAADRDAVVALWDSCGLLRPWNDPYRDIERKLTVQPELFLVGEAACQVVATAMAGYDGHRGWVNYLAVHPDHRRQGHGRALMARVEELLLERGCPKLNLLVRTGNDDAIGFYRTIGYEVDQTVPLGKRLLVDQTS